MFMTLTVNDCVRKRNKEAIMVIVSDPIELYSESYSLTVPSVQAIVEITIDYCKKNPCKKTIIRRIPEDNSLDQITTRAI